MRKRPDYQVEPVYLVDEIMSRGLILPWELLRMVSWKSAKGVAWLSLNTEDEIKDVTQELVTALNNWSGPQDVMSEEMVSQSWDDWQSNAAFLIGADKSRTKDGVATGLLRLSGVGYPVATAILGLLKPTLFPVMDRWAVETIFGEGSSKKLWQQSAAYRVYAERLVNPNCVELEQISSLRERDKAAMNASMNRTSSEDEFVRMFSRYEAIPLPN